MCILGFLAELEYTFMTGVGPPDPCADACPVHLVVSRRADIVSVFPTNSAHEAQRSPRRNPLAAIAIASNEKATQ